MSAENQTMQAGSTKLMEDPLGMSKEKLLHIISTQRGRWEALLDEVGRERMEACVAGDWSVRDIVDHLNAYARWAEGHISAAISGRRATPMEMYGVEEVPQAVLKATNEDAFNSWMHEQNLGLSVDEVLSESRHNYEALVALVKRCTDEQLLSTDPRLNPYPWQGGRPLWMPLCGATYGHALNWHAPDIRSWLGRPGDVTYESARRNVILRELAAARARWDDALERLGTAGLLQPAYGDGWLLKDVLWHLTLYTRWTARIVEAPLMGLPRYSNAEARGMSVEQRNQLYYNQGREKTPEQVMTIWRDSNDYLVQLLSVVPMFDLEESNQYEDWEYIDGNTTEHYNEHYEELKELLS